MYKVIAVLYYTLSFLLPLKVTTLSSKRLIPFQTDILENVACFFAVLVFQIAVAIIEMVVDDFCPVLTCHAYFQMAVAIFEMVEYYESACKLNISFNKGIGPRGWQSCSKLVRKV